MIWSIAWRNIWRNKVRSLIVIIAVILGLVGGIFSLALMNGMMQQMVTASIETQLSNIQLHNPKYEDNDEIKYFISNADSVCDIIKQNPEVKAICRRTAAPAMASTATTGTGVTINGINPDEEEKVTDVWTKIIEGSYFKKETRSAPIVVGKKLAHKLNAKIGNKIIITIQSLRDTITYGAFRVVGIFETQNSMFDESMIFVKNEDLCKLIGFDLANTTEIAVKLNDNFKTAIVAESLAKEFPKLMVQSWMQIRPEYELFNSWVRQLLYIFLLIILLALAFGIVNAMLMAVMERVRELGMLMAVGMNKRRVFKMIMLETIFLSITGGFIGIIISFILIQYFANAGIDLSIVSEGMSAIGYSSIAYPSVGNEYYLIIGIMVIVTAVLSSIYPARKALKLRPAEAIREDA